MAAVDQINVVADPQIQHCSALVNGTTYGMRIHIYFSFILPFKGYGQCAHPTLQTMIEMYYLCTLTKITPAFPLRLCRLSSQYPQKWGL